MTCDKMQNEIGLVKNKFEEESRRLRQKKLERRTWTSKSAYYAAIILLLFLHVSNGRITVTAGVL